MWFANIISFFVLFALLLIPIIVSGRVILNRKKYSDNYISAIAGVLAGYVFYTIYVLWQASSDILSVIINQATANGFLSFMINAAALASGFILGMSFLTLIYKFIASRYIGMLNLSLTLVSIVSLHNFFFLNNSKVFVNYFALSFAGGIFIHVILNPKPLKDLFS